MESARNELPALQPVRVPWQVAASAAFLRRESRNVPVGQPLRVDFVAFFGLHVAAQPAEIGTKVTIVTEPPPFQKNDGSGVTSQYHQVRVQFDSCRASRLLPAKSDSSTLDESAYDWTGVPGRVRPGENVESALQRIRTDWMSSGVCPNPRMYEAIRSPWMRELGLSSEDGWKHYLVAGTDEYLEVIASGWSWTLGRSTS